MLILRQGSTGPEVSNLQNLLNAKLRPSPPLAVDGKFGPKTDKAVRQYQDDNWLVVDGLVGPCTIAALKGTEKYVILHRVTLIPQPSDTTCWAASTAMVLGQSVNSIIAQNRSLGLTDSTDGQPNDSSLQQPENMEKFAAANGFGVLYGQSWTASGLAAELRPPRAVMDQSPLGIPPATPRATPPIPPGISAAAATSSCSPACAATGRKSAPQCGSTILGRPDEATSDPSATLSG